MEARGRASWAAAHAKLVERLQVATPTRKRTISPVCGLPRENGAEVQSRNGGGGGGGRVWLVCLAGGRRRSSLSSSSATALAQWSCLLEDERLGPVASMGQARIMGARVSSVSNRSGGASVRVSTLPSRASTGASSACAAGRLAFGSNLSRAHPVGRLNSCRPRRMRTSCGGPGGCRHYSASAAFAL